MTLYSSEHSIQEQLAVPQGHFFASAQGTGALWRNEHSVSVASGALLQSCVDEIEENWEGCCEDPIDDDYYDRPVKVEDNDAD